MKLDFMSRATTLALVALLGTGCSFLGLEEESDDNTQQAFAALAVLTAPAEKSAVVENYANLAYYTYKDALTEAEEFKSLVDTFAAKASPTAADLTALQEKYRQARQVYLLTEAFRFSDGPIDNTSVFTIDGEEAEGLLNAWPLDEANLKSDFITGSQAITTANLLARNGFGGDESRVTIGWHAIEFILWGEDNTGGSANSDEYNTIAGQRSSSDFTTAGTGSQNAKRSKFLQVATERLVNDLTLLTAQWDPSVSNNYRNNTFLVASNQDTVLKSIITGLATFSQTEWGGERMKGLTSGSQNEDEHSCFSDLTKDDFYYDAQGVLNVITGKFTGRSGTASGPGIGNLISSLDSLYVSLVSGATVGRDAYDPTQSWRYDRVINFSRDSTEDAVHSSLSSARETIVGLGSLFTQLGNRMGYSITVNP
ncbi:MAG: hypothetical protein KDK33_13400 [Leptospiraceae bacterium]|nr:hypothetical protein [Leptospiraceae bacterium]